MEQEEWVTCGTVQGKAALVLKEFDFTVEGLLEGEVGRLTAILCVRRYLSVPSHLHTHTYILERTSYHTA